MEIQIKNNTNKDITVIPEINFKVSDEFITYFNSLDNSTYEVGYILITISYLQISKLIDDNSLSILWNGILIEDSKTFLSTRNIAFSNIFNNSNIPYEAKNSRGIYFGLADNSIKVFNPISEKWYSIQLNEIK